MHHGEALPENMDARETTTFENVAAALALHEGESQQHDHERRQPERMRNETLGNLKGRIGYDAGAAGRHLGLPEEVPDKVQSAIVVDVAGDHRMAAVT
jgi:hypothetical protein